MHGARRLLWIVWGIFVAYLIFTYFAFITHSGFGNQNLIYVRGAGVAVGQLVAGTIGVLIRMDSVSLYYNRLDPVWIRQHPGQGHPLDAGAAFVVILTLFLSTLIVALIVDWAFRKASDSPLIAVPGDAQMRSHVGWIVILIVSLVVVALLIQPIRDLAGKDQRERQSAAIQAQFDGLQQNWAPADLGLCKEVADLSQNDLNTHGTEIGNCAIAVITKLHADAQSGIDPNPSTSSEAFSYLQSVVKLAANGRITNVAMDDGFFQHDIGDYVTTGSVEDQYIAWRKAAQQYLGMLETKDARDTKDVRMQITYKLNALFEQLWISDNTDNHDMARRISAVTEQHLHCVPSVLWADGDTSKLPDCKTVAEETGSSSRRFIGLSTMGIVSVFLILVIGAGLIVWLVRRPNAPYKAQQA